jgi:two-component system, chemotaxis family, sensor kinase CheA
MSDNEIVGEFLVESYENLDRLDREFVSLEKDPRNTETLASIFRTIHTIKGTCGFLGFSKLEAVAHVGENLLSKIRDGVIHLNPEITTALLAMVDAIRQMLTSIENSGTEGERNDADLIATLTRLQTTEPGAQRTAEAAAPKPAPPAPDLNMGDLDSERRSRAVRYRSSR